MGARFGERETVRIGPIQGGITGSEGEYHGAHVDVIDIAAKDVHVRASEVQARDGRERHSGAKESPRAATNSAYAGGKSGGGERRQRIGEAVVV